MTMPSISRDVHYVSAGSADGKFPRTCRAAKVTEVDDPNGTNADLQRVGLMVMNPTGIHFRPLSEGGAKYDGSDDPAPYTWHWPERV